MNIHNRLEQIVIEDKYSRHNVLDHLKKGIPEEVHIQGCKAIWDYYVDDSYYESKQRRVGRLVGIVFSEILMEVLATILACDGPQTIQSICGRVQGKLGQEDVFDGVKTAAELIAVLEPLGLYQIIPARDSAIGSIMVESLVELNEETQQYLSNVKYLPPMICAPMAVTSNRESGYLTKDESVILKDNHHNEKLGLDAINMASSVELSLDEDMLRHEELPTTELDTVEKRRNFERMCISSREVYKDVMKAGNKFWFTWKFDKRGRMYCMGYHINIQGTEYKKALISLANKEVIT